MFQFYQFIDPEQEDENFYSEANTSLVSIPMPTYNFSPQHFDYRAIRHMFR